LVEDAKVEAAGPEVREADKRTNRVDDDREEDEHADRRLRRCRRIASYQSLAMINLMLIVDRSRTEAICRGADAASAS
jgi:hypothetical protein